jgi:hypothetical protein
VQRFQNCWNTQASANCLASLGRLSHANDGFAYSEMITNINVIGCRTAQLQ